MPCTSYSGIISAICELSMTFILCFHEFFGYSLQDRKGSGLRRSLRPLSVPYAWVSPWTGSAPFCVLPLMAIRRATFCCSGWALGRVMVSTPS